MQTAVMLIDLALGVICLVAGALLALGARSRPGRVFRGSSLRSSFWPGLVLMVVVGGSLLAAAVLVMSEEIRTARLVSVEGGVLLLAWSGVVFPALGRRHWSQAAPFLLGIAVVVLSFGLPVPG